MFRPHGGGRKSALGQVNSRFWLKLCVVAALWGVMHLRHRYADKGVSALERLEAKSSTACCGIERLLGLTRRTSLRARIIIFAASLTLEATLFGFGGCRFLLLCSLYF